MHVCVLMNYREIPSTHYYIFIVIVETKMMIGFLMNSI